MSEYPILSIKAPRESTLMDPCRTLIDSFKGTLCRDFERSRPVLGDGDRFRPGCSFAREVLADGRDCVEGRSFDKAGAYPCLGVQGRI